MRYNEIEDKIIKKIKELLLLYKDKLDERKINYTIRYTKQGLSDQIFNSEIEIEFTRNGSFYDIIEFFLFRDGCLIFNEQDGYKELENDIAEIIKTSNLSLLSD